MQQTGCFSSSQEEYTRSVRPGGISTIAKVAMVGLIFAVVGGIYYLVYKK